MNLGEVLETITRLGEPGFRAMPGAPVLVFLKAVGRIVGDGELVLDAPAPSLPVDVAAMGATIVDPDEGRRVFRIDRDARVVFLDKSPLRVGRGPDNELSIPQPTLSKLHATFASSGEGWTLEAHKTSNPTTVNDLPVPVGAPQPLPDGARIALGPEVMVRFWRPASFVVFLRQFAAQKNREAWLTI